MSDTKYSGLYRDVFNFHKEHFPPHDWEDSAFWDEVYDQMRNILVKHGETMFACDLLAAVYEELERSVKD